MNEREQFLSAVDAAAADRGRRKRQRMARAWAISITVTVVWAIYVVVAGQLGRVGDNLIASVTMIFGSMVAGSTPQGGGAVAFPVFTKALEVPAEVARSFSLAIQTIGMGAATLAIIARGVRVEKRALAWGIPSAIVGFIVGLYVLGDPSQPFWPSRVPGPYVKVLFTIVIAAMATAIWLEYRSPLIERRFRLPATRTTRAMLVAVVFAGGMVSSLTGSGTDVFLYVLIAVVLGTSPQVSVPSSVISMAAVSVVGLVFLGLIDGQLDTTVVGDQVVAVGGQSVGMVDGVVTYDAPDPGIEASRFDLFGFWIAAVPVVAWGAPIGAALAARLRDRVLVRVVITLALLETLSTIIFLDELHDDIALIAFFLLGSAALTGLLVVARSYRDRLVPHQGEPTVGGDRIEVDPGLPDTFGSRPRPPETEGTDA